MEHVSFRSSLVPRLGQIELLIPFSNYHFVAQWYAGLGQVKMLINFSNRHPAHLQAQLVDADELLFAGHDVGKSCRRSWILATTG